MSDHETRILAAESDVDGLQAHGTFYIDGTILSDAAAVVTFSSISSDYDTLKLVINCRGDYSTIITSFNMRFNNDSTSGNYNDIRLKGVKDAADVGGNTTQTSFYVSTMPGLNAIANSCAACEILIPSYSKTTFFKNYISKYGSIGHASDLTYFATGQHYGMWESTNAINRIDLLPAAGNFIAGSSFVVYGIK